MKTISYVVFLAFVLNAVAQVPTAPTVTVIRAGTLIDGKSDKPRHDQVIVIRGNRIESISDAGSAKTPVGATVIDLSQQTVLPGLIDSHTHIFLQGEDPAKGGYDANILNAPLALRAARATGMQAAFDKALLQEAQFLRTKIVEGIREQAPGGRAFTPLAPTTLAIRQFRGFHGTKALLVQGDLRNSITVTKDGDKVFVGVLRTAQ